MKDSCTPKTLIDYEMKGVAVPDHYIPHGCVRSVLSTRCVLSCLALSKLISGPSTHRFDLILKCRKRPKRKKLGMEINPSPGGLHPPGVSIPQKTLGRQDTLHLVRHTLLIKCSPMNTLSRNLPTVDNVNSPCPIGTQA